MNLVEVAVGDLVIIPILMIVLILKEQWFGYLRQDQNIILYQIVEE